MNPPTVSVVVPTYNQPALLAETLQTVWAQTFTDFEVVIIDDGSTDDTPARLAKIAAGEPRLRVIRQPNGGIGAARNRGIAESRGEFVALLDHDDLWMPDKLAEQVAFFRRRPEVVTVGVPWAYSTSPDRPAMELAKIRDADGLVPRPLRVLAHGTQFLQSSSTAFRRAAAEGLRYGTERGAIEDMQVYIHLFARGPVGLAGESVGMVYRVHADNFSSNASYFDRGLRLLRRADAAGEFADVTGALREDLAAYLAHLGHTTATRQLLAGRRRAGAAVYLREFWPLVRLRRFKFLLAYPPMLLAPKSLVDRRWGNPSRVMSRDR